MTWTPLRERINKLPLVLAGPILRRTEPNAVTVWVALKESRNVTLEIFDTNKRRLFSGSQKTIQVGTYLHVVAVTAKTSSNVLCHGENYLYNLYFGHGETLNQPGVLTQYGSIENIIYPPYDLPSFALVPSHLNDVRIIHGSCRKPHGESLDALVTVDKMIREALEQDSKKRPHQLFLTGDQIYVDDVADALLFMLMDASQTLLGWTETLPDVQNSEELNPGKRNNLATHTAGLTASFSKLNKISNVAKSHLFTLGEFLAMYLFAWSDVLWIKPEDFPSFEDVFPDARNVHPDVKISGENRTSFTEDVIYLQYFQVAIKDIRRALANVPTYMIFDDHEITDDWFLNIAWCDRTLNKPLGRRILQNGLLACAICQAWGNTPEQFEQGKPGEALLKATEAWLASFGTNPQYEQEIALRVGLPSVADIKTSQPRRVIHQEGSLKWHYTVTAPEYEVLVLDTRTWREFPGKDFDFPGLLSAEGCDEQISKVVRPQNTRVTLVIAPSPVIGLPFLETLQKTAKTVAEKLGAAAWGFDPEAWGLEETAFERLFSRLALRALPAQQSRVIILSGDVHYSFAARLQYSAIRPFQSSKNVKTELVVAQFTSSSLKNEAKGFGGSHSLHKKGFVPFAIIKYLPTAEVIGWENKGGNVLEIGGFYTLVDQTVQHFPWRVKCSPAKVDLVQERDWFRVLQITKQPEWWYRINFLSAKTEAINEPRNYNSPQFYSVKAPLPGQERKQPLEQYLAMARNSHDYIGKKGKGREVVGLNNIGEITFEFVDGKEIAVQTLWWRLESREKGKLLEPFPLTRCEVSLAFDNPNYPMDEVLKEVKW
ncbi:hypothetical protein [Brasilonema bromeliae]|uniref:PhoD-like phosphatase n=1 Tax=Brasilonema bromeliae SPC951 TaxID=385972 RepID=A0ABX1PFZ1_9CYAN|nr:hypothetical protein [Brasilonema bromeliae]NMG22501.1 hypothetical protein [Brasilonema bromeliae SPC951]